MPSLPQPPSSLPSGRTAAITLRTNSAPKAPDCGAVHAEVEYSPFYGIEKGAVLQEARMFNDRVVDARRCQQVPPCYI